MCECLPDQTCQRGARRRAPRKHHQVSPRVTTTFPDNKESQAHTCAWEEFNDDN